MYIQFIKNKFYDNEAIVSIKKYNKNLELFCLSEIFEHHKDPEFSKTVTPIQS